MPPTNSPVPTDANAVEERDTRAAAVVLPEHEQRLIDAHARNAHPNVIAGLQAEYDQARYDEIDAEDRDDDADDGLDDLSRSDMDRLGAEHGVDLSGARTNAERRERLREAGVSGDDSRADDDD
jgi:hypothetical protein